MIFTTRRIFDYSLLIITIAVSGTPYFSTDLLNVPLFIILFIVFLLRKKNIDILFLWVVMFFIIVTALQTYMFNFFSLQSVLGAFLRVVNGYLIIKILGTGFARYYVNTFTTISILSLIFFILILLVPDFSNFLKGFVPYFQIFNFADSEADSILIYTIHHYTLLRNPGPFWEAGAFGGYLVLAYALNSIMSHKNDKLKKYVLLVTILSTFSTTAYLALFTFILIKNYTKTKNLFLRMFFVLFLSIFGYFAVFNISFLGEKIVHQMTKAAETDDVYKDSTNSQRFLNILRDYEDLKGYEISGRGSNPFTRYSFDPENQIRTVGLTDLIVRLGVPYLLFIMFLLHRSLNYFVKFYIHGILVANYNKALFITIILILMSQVYFNFPLFWSLIFLSCVYKKTSYNKL